MSITEGRVMRVQRVVCASVVAVSHLALFSVLDRPVALASRISSEPVPRLNAPLIVTMISVQDEEAPSIVAAQLAQRNLSSELTISVDSPQLPAIEAVAADSLEEGRRVLSSNDLEEANRLQGIYVRQIKARLLRLLESSPPTNSKSSGPCVIHIVQDERGAVLDVITDECESDAAWASTVVYAVREASPLPIPPEGLAMGSYLTLDLTSF